MVTEEGSCSPSGNWCLANGFCQIGYGHDANFSPSPCVTGERTPITVNGVTFTPPLSQPAQVQILTLQLADFGQQVETDFNYQLSQNQADALVSFAYNLPPGTLGAGHTLYEYLINGGDNPSSITADFELYHFSGNTPLQGLFNRRCDEALMYLYGEYTHAPPANQHYGTRIDLLGDCLQ